MVFGRNYAASLAWAALLLDIERPDSIAARFEACLISIIDSPNDMGGRTSHNEEKGNG